MIICRAPLRMSFVGGGSDLPSYFKKKGGAVLSTSINKYVYVTVNKKFDNNIRLSYSITENVNNVEQIKHPIVRNTLKFLGITNGIEITSVSDIPSLGSGLGSSSSFTIALVQALYAFKGKSISKEKLAKLSSHIEINLCGEKIGYQDQFAASYGGLNLIEFKKDDTILVNPINCKTETIEIIENSIILFYTGRTRKASSILKEQSENMKNSLKSEMMEKMVSLAYDMKNQLQKNNIEFFGELLNENWKLKKQMTNHIADSQIDEWYDKGITAGALGGKLLGAGNGGFMMFFAPQEKHKKIIHAMKDLRRVPFSFDKKGSEILFQN